VRVFFIGDGSWCATAQEKPANASYDFGWMFQRLSASTPHIGVCGTCMEQRGIAAEHLLEGARQSTLDELARWTADAERIITF
jgi:uncharacterized protein involved in oxidation of intracellular sulfur